LHNIFSTLPPKNEGRGWYLAQFLNALLKLKQIPLNVVEAGCLRNTEFRIGDGHSTYYIAQWIKEHGGAFTSIDNDPSAVATCSAYLVQEGLHPFVNLICADSVSTISASTTPIDLAFLDGGSYAINLEEYKAVSKLLREPALVVIDDCYETPGLNMPSLEGFCRGEDTIHYATAQGFHVYKLYCMAVISHGCDFFNNEREDSL
jgi:predicted O-methyltransferase YrrM